MAQVTLTVNGRSYEVACDDGQEEHLTVLARQLDERIRDLAASVGAVGESRLLLMASLLIAHELHENRRELGRLGERGTPADARAATAAEERAASALEGCAERLEHIVQRLEAS